MIIKNMFEILKKREKIRFSATDPLFLLRRQYGTLIYN